MNREAENKTQDKMLDLAVRRIEEGENLEEVVEDLRSSGVGINDLQKSPDYPENLIYDAYKAVEIRRIIEDLVPTTSGELPVALVGIEEMLRTSSFPVHGNYILNQRFRRRDWFLSTSKSAPYLTLQITSRLWEVDTPEDALRKLEHLPIMSPDVSWKANKYSEKVMKILKWEEAIKHLTKQEVVTLASFWFVSYMTNLKGVSQPSSVVFLEDSLWKILEEKYGKSRKELSEEIEKRRNDMEKVEKRVGWDEVFRFPGSI